MKRKGQTWDNTWKQSEKKQGQGLDNTWKHKEDKRQTLGETWKHDEEEKPGPRYRNTMKIEIKGWNKTWKH